jgi:hypothetical protein
MALRIARSSAEPQDEDQQDLFADYVAAKQAVDQAQRHLNQIKAKLVAEMGEKHQKSWTKQVGNRVHTVTYVQSNKVEIDTTGLRKALTAKVYDKYTTRELDTMKLQAAMDEGDVDPMVVARFAQEKPGTPYLRYSNKVQESE